MLIHLVYEEEYVEQLKEILESAGHIISDWDYSLSQFVNFSEKKQTKAEIALIDGQAGVIEKQEIIDSLGKVRKNLPNLRLIAIFPVSLKKDEAFINKLLTFSIYDMYFCDEYDIDDLETWINNPKSFANYNVRSHDIKGTITETEKPRINYIEEAVSPEPPASKSQIFKNLVEHITIPPPIWKTQQADGIVGCITIAVAGLQHGSGTTYNALRIARYLADLKFKVAVVELKPKNLYGLIYYPRKRTNDSNSFQYQNFHIYANDGEITPDELLIKAKSNGYNYLILDTGLLFKYDRNSLDKPETVIKKFDKGAFYNTFMQTDLKILTSFAGDQHLDSIEFYLNYLKRWNIKDIKTVFSFTTIDAAKDYKFKKSEVYISPINSNSVLTEDQKNFYQKLLYKALPNNTKKELA